MNHARPTLKALLPIACTLLTLCTNPVLGDPPEPSTPGLRAYWNTNARTSDRAGHVDWEQYDLVTQVDQVNFARTNGSFYIGGPSDYFAVRLVGQIDVPQDGDWTFKLENDQSAFLLIDGVAVVVDDTSHSMRSKTGTVNLLAGLHDFEVYYWEGWSEAALVAKWYGPGLDSEEVIPASAFTSPAEEPVYDPGGDGLWAYWYHNARHASNVGQIDWSDADRVGTVQRPSYRMTNSGFAIDGPSDYFAARFIGIISIDTPGTWTFDLGSDQSALLFIDGVAVVSDPEGHSYRWKSGTIDLREGDHTIEVRYWEGWSEAALHVAWKGPGDAYAQIIPSSAFRPGDGASIAPSGGGLRAYRYNNARHATGVGSVDWADHDSTETVQNVYWPISSGAFFTSGPSDYHATRLVGKINFPRPGTWTLGLGSDQSARVYIDSSVAVDDSSDHSFRWKYGTVSTGGGQTDIEVQFWEGWSESGLVLTWKGPGDEFEQVIPSSALSVNAVDPALGTGGNGLRVYWVDNAHHASHAGHIDWQNYDRMTYEANLAWELTNGVFTGTTITNNAGSSTSSGGERSDHFGLRAVGQIEIPSDGAWGFRLGADQSAQLYIDGKLVVNDTEAHSFRWKSGKIELSAGLHDFEVRYWEGWSEAGLVVSWTPPRGVEEVIPPSAFSHSDTETPYDSGGGGLRAYWTTNARHASNAGQIDFTDHDHATTVPNIAWRITNGSFDDDTPADYMGLRLLGQIDIPATGSWTFAMGSDQSAVMLIDGEPVVSDPDGHSYRWKRGTTQLRAGKHEIELRYWEGWSEAGLHLAWEGPTVPEEIIIPRTAFSLNESETPFEPGGGLRAYWTTNARHASNAGQIDYAEHSSTEIVDNISWPVTSGPFTLDGPNDYFGLRLIGQLTIPESGAWTFSLGSDQSAYLLIDGDPVVVDTSGHSYRWKSGTMDLAEGEHTIDVRYWEGWSEAGLNLTWKAPGATYEEIIPASAFAVLDPEPVYDNGEASLNADWFINSKSLTLDTLESAEPIKTTTEARVSWNITNGPFEEDTTSDYFGLRLTGVLDVPRSGTWTFGLGSDQYAQVLIDGETVINDSSGHSYRWRNGTLDLSAGEHDLEVRFIEGWSEAGLFLSWKGPGDLFEEIIPASAFVPRKARLKVVQWREISGHRDMSLD